MRHLTMALAVLALFAGIGSMPAQSSPLVIAPFVAGTPIRVLAIGGNQGNQAANQVFSGGFLTGTCDRLNDTAAFNAMTPAQIRAAYDVLYVTWNGDFGLNLDWTTRVLPFLQLGGNVMFEDPNNIGDLAPAIIGFENDGEAVPYILTPVAGLTDGIAGNFVNHHTAFVSWDSAIFTPFISDGFSTVGLYGQIPGGGRILVTGPDQDYHSSPGEDQFNFLVNEIRWVSTTILTRLADLRTSVQGLVGPGKLSASYANTMIQLLNLAEARYKAGQKAQAATLIRSFLTYISRALTSGWITAAEATSLRDQANGIIVALTGGP